MRKKCFLSLCLSLVLVLLFFETGAAQDRNQTSWQASYWNNKQLSGSPVLERRESSVDYNWRNESPAPEVRANNFSARWTRTIAVEPATYRFTATSDDGIRVWINGELIIDEWYEHSLLTVNANVYLDAGSHDIRVEYFENSGDAVARLSWRPVNTSDSPGWRGQYFNNENLEGNPRVVRNDAQIGFNWGMASPIPDELDRNHFSVRWTQNLSLPAGVYRFVMTVDDGGRLWVNNQLLIDAWQIQSPAIYRAEIYIPEGTVPVRMDYFDHEGGAIAQLRWNRVTETPGSWQGEYFNNPELVEPAAFTRNEAGIDFNWGTGSPDPRLNPDHFSIRWQQSLYIPESLYCFALLVDDGGRIWVNGRLIIDAWEVQASRIHANKVNLPGGVTSMRMEYFEDTGLAQAQLGWFQFDSATLNDLEALEERGLASLPDDPAVVQGMVNACKNQPILTPASQ